MWQALVTAAPAASPRSSGPNMVPPRRPPRGYVRAVSLEWRMRACGHHVQGPRVRAVNGFKSGGGVVQRRKATLAAA